MKRDEIVHLLHWQANSWPLSHQLSSITQSCPTLCDPINCSMPGLPVELNHSVVSDSLRPHKPQYARPLCPSPTPRVHPNPCLFSRWCHPTISSCVVPFSSCLQSFPASGCFQTRQLFTSGGQVLEFQLQHQSFQWTPRTDLL